MEEKHILTGYGAWSMENKETLQAAATEPQHRVRSKW